MIRGGADWPVQSSMRRIATPQRASILYQFDRILSDLYSPFTMTIGAVGQIPSTLGRLEKLGGWCRGCGGRKCGFAEIGGVMATAVSEAYEQSFSVNFQAHEAYRPSANEEFMNPDQLAYFRQKLLEWKEGILRESRGTMAQLKSGPIREADLTDRASSETDWSIELRTRDRQRKLISKIDSALRRIESGEYGFCEVSGEPISLARLEARPIATMTVEAQERHERNERITREE
jgi:DnaK suppressor protein